MLSFIVIFMFVCWAYVAQSTDDLAKWCYNNQKRVNVTKYCKMRRAEMILQVLNRSHIDIRSKTPQYFCNPLLHAFNCTILNRKSLHIRCSKEMKCINPPPQYDISAFLAPRPRPSSSPTTTQSLQTPSPTPPLCPIYDFPKARNQQYFDVLNKRPISSKRHLLSFQVCGGLTNQRISIVTAILLAKWTDRVLILPRLMVNGTQVQLKEGIFAEDKTAHTFETIYDVQSIATSLKGTVDFVTGGAPITNSNAPTDLFINRQCYEMWSQKLRREKRSVMSLGCTFLGVDTKDYMDEFWRIDEMLTFSREIQSLGNSLIKLMSPSVKTINFGEKYPFYALHLRVEHDWYLHCQTFKTSNCYRNSDVIQNTLYLENIPTNNLYIAGGSVSEKYIEKFASHGYRNITTKTSLQTENVSYMQNKGREFSAAVDWYVCSFSDGFIGNSWSTFTSFLLMRRRQQGICEKDFHYNGDSIPLEFKLPVYQLSVPRYEPRPKWVGTVTSMVTKNSGYHLASVVTSILTRTTIQPVLIFLDSCPTALRAHLESLGCKVIDWVPLWVEDFAAIHKPSEANMDRFVDSFLRLDIPLVGIINMQVLYTDLDVVFLMDFPWVLLGWTPLIACAPGITQDMTMPCDTGVMLINVQGLFNEHEKLIESIIQSSKDESIIQSSPINVFLQSKLTQLSPTFNWKPYWSIEEEEVKKELPKLLHFHGPTVFNYMKLFECLRVLSKKAETQEVVQCLQLDSSDAVHEPLLLACWKNTKSCKCSLRNTNVLHNSSIVSLPERSLYTKALDTATLLDQYLDPGDCVFDLITNKNELSRSG